MRSVFAVFAALFLTVAPFADATAGSATHRFVHVALDKAMTKTSGRLLIFAEPLDKARAAAKGGDIDEVDLDLFRPTDVTIMAREVTSLAPGQGVDVDGDDLVWPAGLSTLSGDIVLQAVLDVGHEYSYTGRKSGDLLSDVQTVHLAPGTPLPTLSLTHAVPPRDPWHIPGSAPKVAKDAVDEAKEHTRAERFNSPLLSAFAGHAVSIRAWVLTPPGYDASATTRYPTVYYTHGFGAGFERFATTIAIVWDAMKTRAMPPMIWVFLDESGPTGTHEFADSVNNGPWGAALTGEYIPMLETKYRMDGKASGRFLNGHSSGGWATLWLQTRYPALFGGTWSTSPDPSDFHDFTGIDLYAPGANAYHAQDGTPVPLMRASGRVVATFETFARIERVLGDFGGQLASFEWVFSPKGPDGRPMPLFNRDTGAVEANVAAYWREHYDIAERLRRHWPELKGDLDGKIHVIVGTNDTCYLDGPVHRLKDTLDGLGARSDIRFLPGKTHFDLYTAGDDRYALLKAISWEMYALARPGARRPSPAQDSTSR
ncbi:enterochelin esterase [Luteibacter pinisoli]|uniref:Enterochelin esterase n=2 Tax=Luteibacter pinisoli TaxID=2589080 RepID=A0A4Y5Z9I5_9GAMM|nr:enterochelin esterase [Luteibacter pinisoli]